MLAKLWDIKIARNFIFFSFTLFLNFKKFDKMPNLLEEISKILDCTSENVHLKLANKFERERVLDQLRGKALRTNYFDRKGLKRVIYCEGITTLGSHQILAYGDLHAPFNISVWSYFHVRHRIVLKYPFHQCLHYKNCFYPLELLEICPIDDNETDLVSPIIMKNLRLLHLNE